jgi:hypothetical protein
MYRPMPYTSIYMEIYLLNSRIFNKILIFIIKGMNKMRNFVICVHLQTLLGFSNKGGEGRGVYFVWERREIHTGCWWKNLKEADNLKAVGLGCKIILKCTLKKLDGRM